MREVCKLPEEPGRKGGVGLCINQVVGILDDAGHAAGFILVVQSGAKLVQDCREDLQPHNVALHSSLGTTSISRLSRVGAMV